MVTARDRAALALADALARCPDLAINETAAIALLDSITQQVALAIVEASRAAEGQQ